MFWHKRNWFTKRVYADAAAATPLSRRAARELNRLLPVYGNAGALHAEAQAAKKELEQARATIAKTIGAHPDEIVFTASGTEANNLALTGVLKALSRATQKLPPSGEVNTTPIPAGGIFVPHAVTTAIEHQSVLEPLRALAREGLVVTEVPVQQDGTVHPNAILEAVQPNTMLVSVQLVNSEVGTVEPIKDIAKNLRRVEKKIYFHTDPSQAPLWLPLTVEKLGVDLMTLDAQKVLGPKGIGVLYIKRGTPIESIVWGGKQERGLRGGTENVPLAGAFAVALADAQRLAESRAKKISKVRDYLWSEIKKAIPEAVLHGPGFQGESLENSKDSPWKSRVANNLNLSIPGLDGEMATVSMDALGVAISTRSACTIGDEEPSHVIAALGVERALLKTAIRITLLPDCSYRHARTIAAALKETTDRYRART